MKIEYKNWNWEIVKEIEVDNSVFDYPLKEDLVAHVVRWQLAKSRSGNHSTKTRSMVSGTNKKPFAQKETGKSRQGSLRSPHFRGGGVVFGPHPRSYLFKLNKKIRKMAACSVISDKLRDNKLHVLSDFNIPFYKTKDFIAWKDKLQMKSILFVVGDEFESSSLQRVFSNAVYCNILPVRGFNVYDGIRHENVIFDVSSLFQLQDRYVKQIIVDESIDEVISAKELRTEENINAK